MLVSQSCGNSPRSSEWQTGSRSGHRSKWLDGRHRRTLYTGEGRPGVVGSSRRAQALAHPERRKADERNGCRIADTLSRSKGRPAQSWFRREAQLTMQPNAPIENTFCEKNRTPTEKRPSRHSGATLPKSCQLRPRPRYLRTVHPSDSSCFPLHHRATLGNEGKLCPPSRTELSLLRRAQPEPGDRRCPGSARNSRCRSLKTLCFLTRSLPSAADSLLGHSPLCLLCALCREVLPAPFNPFPCHTCTGGSC